MTYLPSSVIPVSQGSFSTEALVAYEALVSDSLPLNFSEKDTYDFTRCVRPNGTAYGTRGECRKGTEQEKTYSSRTEGYMPKKPSLGGSVRLLGEDIWFSLFDVDSAKGELKRLKEALPEKLEKIDEEDSAEEDKEKRKRKLKSEVSAAEVSLKQAVNNHKFLEDLKENIPEGIELRLKGGTIIMLSKSKNNSVIKATYSVEGGFNFVVNGEYDIGQITDRREQLEIALKVKKSWDALTQSLPSGSIVKTSAWEADGKGKEREKAYMRVGFGEPLNGGEMYSQKRKDGSMAPMGDKEKFEAQRKDPNSVFFSESPPSKEEIRAWMQILTGDPFLP